MTFGRRHHANEGFAPGEDPTTGEGPAGWRTPPIPLDIDPETAQQFAAAWLALVGAFDPLQKVQATQDVASAEWYPYFAAIEPDGMPHQLIGAFPTQRSFSAINPAQLGATANTIDVWIARDPEVLQTALQQPTLGATPVQGVMLLAVGMSLIQTHRLQVYAGVPLGQTAGIVTGWVEGSARARQVPWEPVV